jgi:hypothetical protein
METPYIARTILTFVYGNRYFTGIAEVGQTAAEVRSKMCNNITHLICCQERGEAPCEVQSKMSRAAHEPKYDQPIRKTPSWLKVKN